MAASRSASTRTRSPRACAPRSRLALNTRPPRSTCCCCPTGPTRRTARCVATLADLPPCRGGAARGWRPLQPAGAHGRTPTCSCCSRAAAAWRPAGSTAAGRARADPAQRPRRPVDQPLLERAGRVPRRAARRRRDRDARARGGAAASARRCRTLEPLYSLADFCYAVRREVIEAIGGADEGYGLGPCWEMDYNVRAARAGFGGVWVVRRLRPSARRSRARRRREEARALRGEQAPLPGQVLRRAAARREDRLRAALPRRRVSELRARRAASRAAPARRRPPRQSRPPRPVAGAPLVSCIMPTRDRRAFVAAGDPLLPARRTTRTSS